MGSWEKVENPVAAPLETGAPPVEENRMDRAVSVGNMPDYEDVLAAEIAAKAQEPFSAGEELDELAVMEGDEWIRTGEPEDNTSANTVIHASGRYPKKGRRRGRHRFAAPLGLLVLLLAATGIVSLAFFGVQAVRRARDDTALREELMDFLDPVIQFIPDPFEDVNDNPQDSLMLAAIWKLTDAERIRQIREKDENSIYPIDDDGFMLIPLKTITDSYALLYGPEAVPQLKSIGEPDTFMYYEYDAAAHIYRVPFSVANSIYTPVLDTLKKNKDQYILRIGYVPAENIGIDEKGNLIDPTPEQAEFFQLFHVQKNGDGWMLTAVEDTSR